MNKTCNAGIYIALPINNKALWMLLQMQLKQMNYF